MLLNKFFYVLAQDSESGSLNMHVRLNPEHEIYKAHFPGQPITPGVCQIQMVTELLSLHRGMEISLTDIKSVKYMAVISPAEITELTVKFLKLIDEGACIRANVVLEKNRQLFSKMSMTYHVLRNHSNI